MTNTSARTGKMVRLAILVAVVLIMAYTPLGYLRTGGLEISFLMVPVAVGGVILGPAAGAILGGFFGITSFMQCFGTSPFGTVLLEISPLYTFIGCVVTRILAGWIPGLIYKAIRGKNNSVVPIGVASLAAPLLNTVLFMSGLVLFFYNTEYIQGIVSALGATNAWAFVVLFVGVQGLIEAVVCFIVATVVSKALLVYVPMRDPAAI